MATAHFASRATPASTRRKMVVAATVGCLLEWYDFAVYGFFSLTIAALFFPVKSEWISLLLAAATFGVGFVVRPIGALVLGALADKKGRAYALSMTIALMLVGTLGIACAPTYHSAGLLGPAIVVASRLIQGFSAGGEMGGATALLIENAPEGRRGLWGSFQQATQILSLLIGSALGVLLSVVLTAEQLSTWGWRLPFFIGLVIGPVGFVLRRQAFAETQQASASEALSPIAGTVAGYRRELVVGFLITVLWTVSTYFFLVYMPTYSMRQLHIDFHNAFLSNSAGLSVALFFAIAAGYVADRLGARVVMGLGAFGLTLLTYPLLALVTTRPSVPVLVFAQCVLGALVGTFAGPAPAALAALYPKAYRSTGISIAYNFAVTIFGGFAPFIATWLIGATGSGLAPAFYVMSGGVISAIGLMLAGKLRLNNRS